MQAGPSGVSDRTSHADFPATQWSRIVEAGVRGAPGDSPQLEQLCRDYWPPLYAFLRRQGHSPHDAEDLVQGFLARLLERGDLATLGPEKGRFRTFLLAGLRNFAVKQALRNRALKRGGGHATIAIDVERAEQLCASDLLGGSPEAAFDRGFAQAVMAKAIAALRSEHHARGKDVVFEAIAPFLDGSDPEGYDEVASRLGLAPGTVAVTVHRMRGRLRELLRAEVRQLCATPSEEDQELRHLLGVWARQPA